MPLKKAKGKSDLQSAISANIRELMADNKKKEKGAGGKARSKKQILAIAISAAKGK